MAYYGSPGPLTTLLHAGIGAAGRIAGDYVSQALMQKRLEEMFSKQQSVGLLTDLLKGQSPEDYQKLAPIVESKLQEQGLFKSGLPKISAEGFLPVGGSPTDSLMSLPEVYKAGAGTTKEFTPTVGMKYAQPAEDIKSLISREGSKWFSGLPEPQKGEVLKSAIAPKNPDLASMIALLGLQLRQGGQEFNQNLQTGEFGLKQKSYELEQNKFGRAEQKDQVTQSQRDTALGLAADRLLEGVVDKMSLYEKRDPVIATKYMDQANAIIKKYNLNRKLYTWEQPKSVNERLGVNIPLIGGFQPGSPKIIGGDMTDVSRTAAPSITPEQAAEQLRNKGYIPDGKGGWVKK